MLPPGLPDNKESIQLGFVGMDGKFPSEEDCPGYECTAKEFQQRCLDVALLLLEGFAEGLGLPSDFFRKVGVFLLAFLNVWPLLGASSLS